MRTTSVIMSDAMDCLIDKLGIVETEIFIANLIKEPFDYTKWQNDKFSDMSLDEINNAAVDYCQRNPKN